MNIGKKWILGLLGAALFGGALVAQTISIPFVTTLTQSADGIQIIPRGVPVAGNVYATPGQVTNVYSYVKAVVTAGGGTAASNFYTNTFGNFQSYLTFVLPGTMAYSYVVLAAAPSDGARECIFAGGGAITNIYITANSGQTLDNAVTTLSTGTGACYIYSLSNLTWDRT